MAAYAYLRVSTDEQATSGLGLEAQRAACEAAAARLGVRLAGVFVDAGVSGKTPLAKRPALADALAALKRGDVLLVAKRDRLARDVVNAAMCQRAVESRKARLVSAAGEGTDDDGPASVLMRTIVDAFAEYERLLISARTRAALRAKAARGERVGSVPFGYVATADGRVTTPHPGEQRTLARLAALRAAGLGVPTICRTLEREGFRTRRGTARWHTSHVRRLLARTAAGAAAVAA